MFTGRNKQYNQNGTELCRQRAARAVELITSYSNIQLFKSRYEQECQNLSKMTHFQAQQIYGLKKKHMGFEQYFYWNFVNASRSPSPLPRFGFSLTPLLYNQAVRCAVCRASSSSKFPLTDENRNKCLWQNDSAKYNECTLSTLVILPFQIFSLGACALPQNPQKFNKAVIKQNPRLACGP